MSAGPSLVAALACAGLLACRVVPPVAEPAKSSAPPCPELPLAEEMPEPPGGLVGTTIARVCLLGASLETRATAERSLQVLAGQPVDTRRVREDLAILLGLGRYDEVAAHGMVTERGLLLLYTVRERPRIAGFELVGAEAWVDPGLVQAFAVNRPLDVRRVHELGRTLLDRCRGAGHVACQVEHRVVATAAGQARVEVVVQPGPLRRIGALSFPGARPGATAELRAATGLAVGQPLVHGEVDAALGRVLALLHAGGRLDAQVKWALGVPAADGAVPLRFEIEEGRVYTLAGLHVTGHAAAQEQRILAEVLTLRVGQVYRRGAVAEDAARIMVDHESRGERVRVTPWAVRDSARATIELSFEVTR